MNWNHRLAYSHFWDVPISRRRFLGSAALAGGMAASAGLWPELVHAEADEETVFPRPIPGGVSAFGVQIHHFPPFPIHDPINEPSAITDFKGIVGITRVLGTGIGTDTTTGDQSQLHYQVDNGFNTGMYIGEDGRKHHGNFAFI